VLKVKTVWDPWILEFLLINKTAQTIVENKYPQILIAYTSRPMLLIQNGSMMEGADGSRNFNYIITMWVHKNCTFKVFGGFNAIISNFFYYTTLETK